MSDKCPKHTTGGGPCYCDPPKFIREERYLVFKISDAFRYLTLKDRELLLSLSRKISNGRYFEDDKDFLQCVVVEHDWPEYEVVWKMIEERATKEKQDD